MTGGVHEALDRSCVVEYGTRVVQKRDGGSVYPVYGGGGATFKMDTFNREDRLVVSRFGMSKECTRFVAGKFFLNDSGLTVRPRDNRLAQRFLDYQILSLNDRIFELGKGSAQKNLDVPAFRQIDIIIPDNIADQQRIVAILDEAFDGIATARANAEQNLQNARAIFESHLQAVFSQRGEGWVEKLLGDVCEFENGDRGKNYPNRHEYVESGIPWINTGHIQPDGTLSMEEMHFISREKFDSLRSGKIRPGDLVYCLRGATLGKTALVTPLNEGAVASSLVILRPSPILHSRFLYFFLTSPAGQGLISGFRNGAAQPNLGARSVAKYPISLPPIDEQERLLTRIGDFRDEAKRLESLYQRKIDALDGLKKSLLNQAFSGNL